MNNSNNNIEKELQEINDDSFEKALLKKTKRYTRGLIARIVIFCLTIIAVTIYPLLPISQIKGLKLQGNYLLNKNDVLEVIKDEGFNTNLPVIFLDDDKLESALEESVIIEKAEVKWRPCNILVVIDEVAAMLQYNDEIYLSNGSTIDELEAENPGFTYNFQATNLPTYLGSLFGKLNKDRQALFLNNLKTIDRSTLTSVKYIDYRGDGDSAVMTDGYVCFYFEDGEIYNRVCVNEAYLSYFLNTKRLTTILNVLKSEPNAKITVDQVNSSIKYRSITCYYGEKTIDGRTYKNPCIVDVNS